MGMETHHAQTTKTVRMETLFDEAPEAAPEKIGNTLTRRRRTPTDDKNTFQTKISPGAGRGDPVPLFSQML